MNVKRITRLIKLLQVLLDGSGHNSSSLAKSCGVSRRTIFRDLEALRRAGVPLKFDNEQERYSIPSTFFLPPTNFTADEALAIIALAREVGRDDRLPFYQAAHSAAVKLESSLPGPLQEELYGVTQSIRIHIGSVSKLREKESVYQQLVRARTSRRVVRIEYESLTEWETISTKLRPYQLMFNRHSWYVIGRSSIHSDIRTFNIGRIVALKVLKEDFVLPRTFRLDRYLGNAWRMIPEPGPDHDVHVHFQHLVARNVAEVLWHKTQRTSFRDDGSLDFHVTVSGLQEIGWWILGYGDQAEVIAPKKLRRVVAQRAKRMWAIYDPESNGHSYDYSS